VNVFIARDGVEIGECPRDEVANHLRSGEILETDHYWHEGMEAWGRIDDLLGIRSVRRYAEPYAPPVIAPPPQPAEEVGPPPPPKNWRLIGATALGASLAVIALGAFLIKPDGPAGGERAEVSLRNPAASPELTYEQVRDKAAAELQQALDRLPKKAAPPSHTFYYDTSATMNRGLSPRKPWSAVIRGSEQTVDAATEQTVSRTDFTVLAEYSDGAWTYSSYQGSLMNLADAVTTTAEHNAETSAPPGVVAMLGLRIPDRPETSLSITK
jgi:hypothetical protein